MVFLMCTGKQLEPEIGVQNFDADMNRWSKANLKAKKLLVLSLDIQPLLRIEGCKTAREIWEKLAQIYDAKSAENIDLLRHRFHDIKWHTTSTMKSSDEI